MIFSAISSALKTMSDDVIRTYVRDYMNARPEEIPMIVEKAGRVYTIVSEEAVRYGRKIQS